MGAAEAVLA
jgi:hypothetical protein